jgi:hypothetical protein
VTLSHDERCEVKAEAPEYKESLWCGCAERALVQALAEIESWKRLAHSANTRAEVAQAQEEVLGLTGAYTMAARENGELKEEIARLKREVARLKREVAEGFRVEVVDVTNDPATLAECGRLRAENETLREELARLKARDD